MERIRLLPEQFESIEKEIEKISASISMLKDSADYKDARPSGLTGSQGFDYIPDFSSLYELQMLKSKLDSLSDILHNSVIINEYDDTKINVGTRFTVSLDFGEGRLVTDDYVLVDYLTESENQECNYVSLKSLLGKTVYQRSTNEVICYTTRDGKIVGGLIEAIAPSRDVKTNTDSDKVYKKR